MSQIVIMPGGFHPFHAGHAALYNSALKAFPNAEVYVAATNDTKTRPFPFEIKEKLAKVAGVKPGHFIQVKSPFQAKEITQNYDPERDTLIFVRSEKDRTEQPQPGGTKKDGSPAYFQPYTGKNMQPFGKHAYMAYLPTVEFGPGIKSATEIRNSWPKLDDRRKLAMVMSLYPAAQENQKLAQNIIKMLDLGMGTEQMNESILQEKPGDVYSKRMANIVQDLGNNYYLGDDSYDDDEGFTKESYSVWHREGPDEYRHVGYVNISPYGRFRRPGQLEDEIEKLIVQDQSLDEEKSSVEDLYNDPETHSILAYAKQHYPEEPDLQTAFVKFVLRSLKHSEEDDRNQDQELERHSKDINLLMNRVKSLHNELEKVSKKSNKVDESRDYLEEK
jgi:hypothetical protein